MSLKTFEVEWFLHFFREVEDPFVKIKTAQKLEKLAKKSPVVAGYFEGETSTAYVRWIDAAKEMKRREDIKFGYLQGGNI